MKKKDGKKKKKIESEGEDGEENGKPKLNLLVSPKHPSFRLFWFKIGSLQSARRLEFRISINFFSAKKTGK